MAHEMHDAGLDCRLRKRCIDGIREAFETVHDGDEDVFDAAVVNRPLFAGG
jgi:hypothetical protein